MELFILVIYNLLILLVVLFSIGQLGLLIRYVYGRWRLRNERFPETALDWEQLPSITVQLPIYNELYVVERLIDAIARLRYPQEKLTIQILDDSTDDTTLLIAKKAAVYQKIGLPLVHIRRPNRAGFKAGALAYGLNLIDSEYVAIFDADFLPDADFLLRVLPSFTQPDIGVVQTRWLHTNQPYSLLTQIQAFGLNAHFLIEQYARYTTGLFLNFSGTAGIWRREAILTSGGWQADTLTEDLDLSYRAQLKDWRIVYRVDVGVPAELPITMDAIKSQQYRWMKGPAECSRKLLGNVWQKSGISVRKKIQACFHLLNSSLLVLILGMALLSLPVLWIHHRHPDWAAIDQKLSNLFLLATLISTLFYGVAYYQTEIKQGINTPQAKVSLVGRSVRFFWLFPTFISIMLGLSLHNSIAVLEGLLGKKTPFVRTPKFNSMASPVDWTSNVYIKKTFPKSIWGEIGLGLYFLAGIGLGAYLGDYSLVVFHSLLVIGYSLVVSYTLAHSWTQETNVAPNVTVLQP
ncbi:glycosyltransferase family 2 protein [Spirosoma terrae]|uniref:Glycosyltransferase n=1 Tax=Spirosoma terrae TaxID=1968276 RepID=A0A6L9LB55_9BACT|nr:glycosyltransferase [Spirosoma terrae]NDU97756.1 glycosyltransferase [Spirosoma terrae]